MKTMFFYTNCVHLAHRELERTSASNENETENKEFSQTNYLFSSR